MQVQVWFGKELMQTLPLGEGEFTIGRSSKNHIVLEDKSVSSRHARFLCENGHVTLEDVGSTNGTFVEETRLTKAVRVRLNHRIKIGEYSLQLKEGDAALVSESAAPGNGVAAAQDQAGDVGTGGVVPPFGDSFFHKPGIHAGGAGALQSPPPDLLSPAPPPPAINPDPFREIRLDAGSASPVSDFMQGGEGDEGLAPSSAGFDPSIPSPFTEAQRRKREQYRSIRKEIHTELFKRMDLKRLVMTGLKDDDISRRARKTIDEIIDHMADRIPRSVSKGQLANDLFDEALGLGPLQPFLEDPEVTEIMVNGPDSIYYEKKGRLLLSENQFLDESQLLGIIERIVAPIGRRIDESQPMVDARLKDGSRVNAIIPPLSLKGPCVTIRKFSKTPFKVSDLIRFGSMTPEMAEFFRICVLLRKNILISGGTGSGKTTLLNVVSNFLPATDRIVTIEDAAELRLNQHHVISLESRPPNIEGKGAIVIRDLVRNALRMRPDRIVVGECRGAEALDMLQAMNTGHDGSLTTLHANSPRDGLARLETMVLMAGMDLPIRAIREQVASAVDIIVQQDRFSDGTRKITSVTEIVGMEKDIITMQELFKYVQTGLNEQGTVLGYFTATGGVPTFMDDIKVRGLSLDPKIFQKNPLEEQRDKFL
jgi:pilus assembly protein CpaF